MEPILVSRKDAAALLGLSLRSIDNLLANGQLAARKVGRRTLILRAALERFARSPETANGAERRKARLIRREAERFAEWARRLRTETAALLRTLDKADADWRAVGRQELETNGGVSERTWGRLHLAWLWAERAEQTWRRREMADFNGRR